MPTNHEIGMPDMLQKLQHPVAGFLQGWTQVLLGVPVVLCWLPSRQAAGDRDHPLVIHLHPDEQAVL